MTTHWHTTEEKREVPDEQEDMTGQYSQMGRKSPTRATMDGLERTGDDDEPTIRQALRENNANEWHEAIIKK